MMSDILSGSGAPSSGLGVDGDTYFDASTGKIYGPKAAGVWVKAGHVVDVAATASTAVVAETAARTAAISSETAARTAAVTTASYTSVDWYNVVTKYGADPTGAADSTVAFQNCINDITGALAPSNHTRTAKAKMYVPAGTFKITSDLHIQSVVGFVLEGAGQDLTRIAPSGAGFTQALLLIDGSLNGVFGGFTVQGDTTEQVTDVIRLDWTTAAQRSTSANKFHSIRIRTTNFVVGISLEGNGSRQVDGTVLENIVITGKQTAGSWSSSGNWQHGLACGNGTQGNNYDHVAYGVGAANCQNGYTVNASSLAVFGAQPGSNGVDFNWVTPISQCTVENIQSQNSGQMVVCASGPSPVPISFRDVQFKGWTGSGYNATWISTGTQGGNWTLENVVYVQLTPPTPPVISVAGGHGGFYGSVFVAINVSQPTPPATGFVLGTGQPVVAIGYQDTTAGVGNNAVLHPLYCKNTNWGFSQGLAASRPAATLNGESMYYATDTSTLSRSNGTAWTTIAIQNAVVTAPDVQYFTYTGSTQTWTKPTSPAPIVTEVYLLGGGSGGGSGSVEAASGAGGGGGGGGALLYRKFVTADLTSTVTVTVGNGGNGGTAVSSGVGNSGSVGTATLFGSFASAGPGGVGGGGSATVGGLAGTGGVGTGIGGAGGAGGTSTTGTGVASPSAAGATGGGGGGGLVTGGAFIGGSSSYSKQGSTNNVGVVGAVDSTLPTGGAAPTVKATPSCGGAGGSSSVTTTAQTGAAAFLGGGGGGGGAAITGQTSGAGGAGGTGFALVISYFQ